MLSNMGFNNKHDWFYLEDGILEKAITDYKDMNEKRTSSTKTTK